MPPRPRRPLSTWRLLRTFPDNSLAACDEELFEELFVERRFFWGRLFIISDPEGIRHILQSNVDNYVRIPPVRRAFTFTTGGGMNHLEGEEWWRHRRTINPALDHHALQPDFPKLIELSEEMAAHLSASPCGQEFEIGRTLTHLLTRTTGHVFTGDDRRIDALLLRLGRFPENYGLLDVLPLPRWLYFTDRYRRSRAGLEEHYALLDRLIAERRSEGYSGGNDLLRRMATARDRQTGQLLTAAELRDEVLTLGAGAQAPLRTMTWAWYLLTQFPAAEQRLHAELDEVLGGRSPTRTIFPGSGISAGSSTRRCASTLRCRCCCAWRWRTTRRAAGASLGARLSQSCRGSCTATASCGRIRTASTPSASRRARATRARAMRIFHSASDRASASRHRWAWPKS